MSILEEIVKTKKDELKDLPPLSALEEIYHKLNKVKFDNSVRSKLNKPNLIEVFTKTYGPVLIAELKKASPSKGLIRENFDPVSLAEAYKQGGAQILSVLTDEKYFEGSLRYLEIVSGISPLPTLRKDFIIDKRQILQAKAVGASAILLIAAILSDKELALLYEYAKNLDLDVLIEVHNREEMQRVLKTPAELIGINNRDLHDFSVSLESSIEIMKEFHDSLEKRFIISESGISSNEDIKLLMEHGVKGFLVGESLMRKEDVKGATIELLQGIV